MHTSMMCWLMTGHQTKREDLACLSLSSALARLPRTSRNFGQMALVDTHKKNRKDKKMLRSNSMVLHQRNMRHLTDGEKEVLSGTIMALASIIHHNAVEH